MCRGQLVYRVAAGLAVAVAAAVVLWPCSPDRAVAAAAVNNDIIITLKNDFIEKYKNRVTMSVKFSVKRPGKIHPPPEDGDMHTAGTSDEIGLPTVAEIMNACNQDQLPNVKSAVQAMGEAKGKPPIDVAGAWRIWCEHAGTGTQVQGDDFPAIHDSNPPHVFEIHPVTSVAGISVLESFKRVDNFTYKEAQRAFLQYENTDCHIRPNDNGTTTIRTRMAGYNMPEFILETLDDADDHNVVEDGRFVFCKVLDTDGELISHKVRLAFVKDSAPEQAIKTRPKGSRLRVAGVPRVDLALVSWRVQHKDDPREPLDWHLPYELVVIAVME